MISLCFSFPWLSSAGKIEKAAHNAPKAEAPALADSLENRETIQIRPYFSAPVLGSGVSKDKLTYGFALTTLCRLVSDAITLSWLNCTQKRTEQIGSNNQCARTFEEIRGCSALPKYLVHSVRRRPDRSDRPQWFGQINAARNSFRPRKTR